MRILNIIGSLNPKHGGTTEGALRLARSLREQGHEVDFATLDPTNGSFFGAEDHIYPFAPARSEPDKIYPNPYVRAYHRWLGQSLQRYDAALVHAIWDHSTLAARRALVGGNIPYAVFPHGGLDPWFAKQRRKHIAKQLTWFWMTGPLLRHADAVLFTTEEERNLAEGSFWPYKVRPAVVGFGASDVPDRAAQQRAAFQERVPSLNGKRFLLYLSRLHPKKGCDLLLRAFARMVAPHSDLDLLIAGPDRDNMRPGLQQIAADMGVAHRIHWTDMIEGDAKWGAYRASEAFALTSHTENFGIVVAEALACAKPVLITDKVNLWREVDRAGAGLIETDTQEGADRLLERYLALPDAGEVADNARRCYESNFRMAATATRIVDVFRARGARN